MSPHLLLFTQFSMFIIMLGTAEELFVSKLPTIAFITAFFIFAWLSIYIRKNEKWLIKKKSNNEKYNSLYQ